MESRIVSELSLATIKWVVAMEKVSWKMEIECCVRTVHTASAICIEYFRN